MRSGAKQGGKRRRKSRARSRGTKSKHWGQRTRLPTPHHWSTVTSKGRAIHLEFIPPPTQFARSSATPGSSTPSAAAGPPSPGRSEVKARRARLALEAIQAPSLEEQRAAQLSARIRPKKKRCGLCEREFTRENLPGCFTRQAVIRLREKWRRAPRRVPVTKRNSNEPHASPTVTALRRKWRDSDPFGVDDGMALAPNSTLGTTDLVVGVASRRAAGGATRAPAPIPRMAEWDDDEEWEADPNGRIRYIPRRRRPKPAPRLSHLYDSVSACVFCTQLLAGNQVADDKAAQKKHSLASPLARRKPRPPARGAVARRAKAIAAGRAPEVVQVVGPTDGVELAEPSVTATSAGHGDGPSGSLASGPLHAAASRRSMGQSAAVDAADGAAAAAHAAAEAEAVHLRADLARSATMRRQRRPVVSRYPDPSVIATSQHPFAASANSLGPVPRRPQHPRFRAMVRRATARRTSRVYNVAKDQLLRKFRQLDPAADAAGNGRRKGKLAATGPRSGIDPGSPLSPVVVTTLDGSLQHHLGLGKSRKRGGRQRRRKRGQGKAGAKPGEVDVDDLERFGFADFCARVAAPPALQRFAPSIQVVTMLQRRAETVDTPPSPSASEAQAAGADPSMYELDDDTQAAFWGEANLDPDPRVEPGGSLEEEPDVAESSRDAMAAGLVTAYSYMPTLGPYMEYATAQVLPRKYAGEISGVSQRPPSDFSNGPRTTRSRRSGTGMSAARRSAMSRTYGVEGMYGAAGSHVDDTVWEAQSEAGSYAEHAYGRGGLPPRSGATWGAGRRRGASPIQTSIPKEGRTYAGPAAKDGGQVRAAAVTFSSTAPDPAAAAGRSRRPPRTSRAAATPSPLEGRWRRPQGPVSVVPVLRAVDAAGTRDLDAAAGSVDSGEGGGLPSEMPPPSPHPGPRSPSPGAVRPTPVPESGDEAVDVAEELEVPQP